MEIILQTQRAWSFCCVKNTEIPLLLEWDKSAYWLLNKKMNWKYWEWLYVNGLCDYKTCTLAVGLFISCVNKWLRKPRKGYWRKYWMGGGVHFLQYSWFKHPIKALLRALGFAGGGINVLWGWRNMGMKRSRIIKFCFFSKLNTKKCPLNFRIYEKPNLYSYLLYVFRQLKN